MNGIYENINTQLDKMTQGIIEYRQIFHSEEKVRKQQKRMCLNSELAKQATILQEIP